MGLVVVASNYLVQFPIQYFGLSEILTYGAFTYPITFLITDLANRAYGKIVTRKIVYIGFFIGVLLTLFFSTNFSNIISIRIRLKLDTYKGTIADGRLVNLGGCCAFIINKVYKLYGEDMEKYSILIYLY